MYFLKSQKYSSKQLACLHDHGASIWSFRKSNNWRVVVRILFARVIKEPTTANAIFTAHLGTESRGPFQASGKIFTHVQSLVGFRYFAVGIFIVEVGAKPEWNTDAAKWSIDEMILTDTVDPEISTLQYNE
jgi:hypothetical protein